MQRKGLTGDWHGDNQTEREKPDEGRREGSLAIMTRPDCICILVSTDQLFYLTEI